tara:strand:+ start:7165 stop:7419 length:255 start_codon:yes stop_codon:yes gene_type:complete
VKDNLSDLNTHLFAQMERLQDEDLKPEDLKLEISRAKATAGIASQIVGNASLVLEAEKLKREGLISKKPAMIEGKKPLIGVQGK